ncbi:MAG: nuclear export factor GLE1, partial [Arthrobacter sp.]|nr:nuclear export factor GLE1 [Arthrobacter sp.]
SVTVTAAAAADGHGAQAASAPDTTPETVQAAAVSDDGAQARSWAGLVAGVGGLALGGLALARSRGNTPAPVRVSAPDSGPNPATKE